MKPKRWHPIVVAVLTGVGVIVGAFAVAELLITIWDPPHPGAIGYQLGRGIPPLAIVAAAIAYFIQRSRITPRRG